MSQENVTLPIRVSKLESQTGNTEPVSDHYVAVETGAEVYRFCEPEYRGTYGPFDPWELRAKFLGWPLREWQSFFVMAGAFGTPYICRDDFAEWQRLMKQAMIVPAHEWKRLAEEFDPLKVERLLGTLPIQFDWDAEPPTATLMGVSPLDSMIASIQMDKLQGAEFRVCARPDCKSPPFLVGTRQKIYCEAACAHLAAVRADRKRKADRAKAKARNDRKASNSTKRKGGR
jgi:hypothetical protein